MAAGWDGVAGVGAGDGATVVFFGPGLCLGSSDPARFFCLNSFARAALHALHLPWSFKNSVIGRDLRHCVQVFSICPYLRKEPVTNNR
jgi:hypothetical protein